MNSHKIFGIVIGLVALNLSAVAAYYSIVGLAEIFPSKKNEIIDFEMISYTKDTRFKSFDLIDHIDHHFNGPGGLTVEE